MFSAFAPTTDITEARQGAADCSVADVMAILLAVVTLTNPAFPDNPQADQAVPSSATGSTRSRPPWLQLVGRVRLALANPPCFVTRPLRLFLPARPAPWRAYRDRACSRARRALPRPAFEA